LLVVVLEEMVQVLVAMLQVQAVLVDIENLQVLLLVVIQFLL
jgi:hypothetical protein